jgi:hypothetical protein
MLPPNPNRIKAVDVPGYVFGRYGLEISRQTVYNWMLIGRNNEKLRYEDIPNPAGSRFTFVRYTSREWVDQFLAAAGLDHNNKAADLPPPQ